MGEPPANVAGIVSFKERFGGELIAVREEWTFEPKPLLARLSRGLSTGLRAAKRLSGGSS